ncbi:NfeD family protein [Segetibacter sp. 3557_3]|uniref:NfeD family protein n=1 Tax=Segetibacter sp. 3557_3 TaxID=2547429 RepID=UPI0014047062|nr:NfeD family protein [Segetibacter sp. 3557_3]
MDNFYNAAVIWFIIGFAFFLLEFVIPGLILFFFAIGAWSVGILSLFMDVSINTQLIIFLSASVLTILLFRKWVKRILQAKQPSSEIEDEFLGKIGKAETAILPGETGKVDFKGTSWNARSEDVIQKGENVTIVGNDSILLIVKSTKTLL